MITINLKFSVKQGANLQRDVNFNNYFNYNYAAYILTEETASVASTVGTLTPA